MKYQLFGIVIIILSVCGLGIILLAVPLPHTKPTEFGVSFSPAHATGIGLDWQDTYQALLSDLQVKHLRLGAYWDRLEPVAGRFDFSELDYEMDEAAKAGATVILTIGRKVQRWPECHDPAWLGDRPGAEKREQLLAFMAVVVKRYKNHPALTSWQLENEPFLDFGACPPGDGDFLATEEALVREMDSIHPIVITDSGELNWWLAASRYGDVLGTTMYRTVFSERLQRPFSYDYIFPAWLYRLKGRYIGWLRHKEVIISELQGEPWGAKPFTELTATERQASMSPQRLQVLHAFAQRTQLPTAYWWGAEYWYWEKEISGNPGLWETAKRFF